MTTKVVTVRDSATFSEIADTFIRSRITSAPVIDNNNDLVGVVSYYDMLSKLFPTLEEYYSETEYFTNYESIVRETHPLGKLTAFDLMSKRLIAVAEEDHIYKACALMVAHRLRRLPVELNHKLSGVVYSKLVCEKLLPSILTKELESIV